MIVERRVRIIKMGRRPEAVSALKEIFDLFQSEFGPVNHRIYRPRAAPAGVLAFEWEAENLAEYDRLLAELLALPEFAELDRRWMATLEPGGTDEIWELVE